MTRATTQDGSPFKTGDTSTSVKPPFTDIEINIQNAGFNAGNGLLMALISKMGMALLVLRVPVFPVGMIGCTRVALMRRALSKAMTLCAANNCANGSVSSEKGRPVSR